MTEAVIVATARTPIGRANKGSLVDCRPDDLSGLIIDALLKKVPELDRALVEDVIWGCGQPAGEAGTNIGRVAGILAGIDAPGVTVNRYCSSSLQTIRMAAHTIKAGEGDVFISGGVETVSRFQYGAADTGSPNGKFGDAQLAYQGARGGWPAVVDTAHRFSRRLHRDGADRRERPRGRRSVARGDGRVLGAVAGASGRRAGQRLLRAGDHAGHDARRHGRIDRRRTTRGHDGREARDAEAGVPSGWRGDRGQRVPAQRRRRRGRRDERHQGQGARHHPSRGSSRAASARSTRRSWGSDRSRRAGRRSSAPT